MYAGRIVQETTKESLWKTERDVTVRHRELFMRTGYEE
jgi:hypothetical protein